MTDEVDRDTYPEDRKLWVEAFMRHGFTREEAIAFLLMPAPVQYTLPPEFSEFLEKVTAVNNRILAAE